MGTPFFRESLWKMQLPHEASGTFHRSYGPIWLCLKVEQARIHHLYMCQKRSLSNIFTMISW